MILNKDWDYVTPWIGKDGSVDLTLGYAYTSAKDVNPTTSSTATSNFEEVTTVNINQPDLAPSQFQNNHNVTAALRVRQEFIQDLSTSFNFFLSARSGRRFSYTYDNNTPTSLFGDSDNEERNLFYVPNGVNDPLVQFASGFDTDGFFQFLETTGLDEYSGEIVPRNAFTNPWFIDLDSASSKNCRACASKIARSSLSISRTCRTSSRMKPISSVSTTMAMSPRACLFLTLLFRRTALSTFTRTSIRAAATSTPLTGSSATSTPTTAFGLSSSVSATNSKELPEGLRTRPSPS